MPTEPVRMLARERLAARGHVWAVATMATGFVFAAIASLTTFFSIHALVEAQQVMRHGLEHDSRFVGGLFDLARMSSDLAFALVLAGACGVLVALALDWRAPHARRTLLVAPALLAVAVLTGPLLHEYTGAIAHVRPMDRVPFLLAMGGVIGLLVSPSRATLPLVSAGTAAIVAGAVQATVRTAWSPMLGLSLPPLAWENAWSAVGFALFAVALAAHAHRTERAFDAPVQAQDAAEPDATTA